MSLDREVAQAFVDAYGETWNEWDIPAFVRLFSDDVVYVAHPTDETVVGSEALTAYVEKEAAAQGPVSVRMGNPLIDGDQAVAEFWVTANTPEGEMTIPGCFIAWIDSTSGLCTHFREYWFDVEGIAEPFEGWGV